MNRKTSTQTTSTHPKDFPIHREEPVIARDGVNLGFVADVLSGHFAVRPESGKPYWLSRSTLAEPQVGQVLLAYDSEEVKELRLEAPVAQADSPGLDAALEAFDDDADVAATRARMERGYGPAPARAPHSN